MNQITQKISTGKAPSGPSRSDFTEKISTLEEWVDVWIHRVLPGVVKETTIIMYRDTMERHVLPVMGNKALRELDEKVIEAWVDHLRETKVSGTIKGTMTEGTVRNTLSVLSGCLRDAQKYGLIEQNPCRQTAWKVQAKNLWKNQDWLLEEQIEKLEPLVMQYRDENGYPRGIVFQLILYAGLTMSEAAGLRWRDVELERQMIHVRRFVVARKKEGEFLEEARGHRRRAVPVPDLLVKRLKEIYEEYGPKEDFFVANPSENEFVRLDPMRAVLFRRSEAAGLGRITPRMLRDTYAIRAVQEGATSDMIAELMGFASPQQVVRRYMPRIPMDKRSLVNRMYREK